MLSNPQNIMEQLARADRAHQQEIGGGFLLRSIKYVCLLVIAAFALDVVFHLSPGWRLALLLTTIGLALGIAGCAWYLAYVRRNRLEHIARFLETRDPALGSRLINLLQLHEQTGDEKLPPLTRALARQATASYAEELRSLPLEKLARTGAIRRHLKHAAVAFLAFAAVLALFFRITIVEVARFADPFGDHPPFSFTQLEIVAPRPTGESVLYGKNYIVKAKASGHRPREVYLSSYPPGRPEQTITVPMFDKGSIGYDQLVDNIRTELLVFAHNKDRTSLSKQARINVVLTPKLEKAFVQITPPAYTGAKAEKKPYNFKGLQALAGSEVQFRLESNRPLREGSVELNRGEQGVQRFPMHKQADNEVTGSLVAANSGRLRFSIVDAAGLPSQDAWEGALTVTHDLPPEVRITEPENDSFVAMDFKLQVQVQANDDYGLRSIRNHRGLNGKYAAPQSVSYEKAVRNTQEVVELNIAESGLQPGDEVSLFAEATDTAPQPHMARSQVVRLKIISVEDYNNFLREQTDIADLQAKYDELIADLQELVEKQKQLGESAKKLQEQMENATPEEREAAAMQLDQLLAQQNELNQKLKQHAERMEIFVREKPLYDVEHELQDLLREQAKTIRESTAANDAVSSSIAQRSSPTTGTREMSPEMPQDFKKASDKQLARLGAVQEESKKQVSETLQDMSKMQELLKDFNQFEALYKVQQEIAAQAQAYNRAGPLSREDQLALKELAATEKQVADLLEQLEQKLREDCKAAAELFPKAAKSGEELADNIKDLRLQSLAQQASGEMLAGDGERSYNLAERLRSEMEKLFSECQGGNCPSPGELDSYLSLQRMMKPGSSFSQMAACQKFGQVGKGMGMGMGMGMGAMGTSGYAVPGAPQRSLLGNEPAPNRGSATAQSSPAGKGTGTVDGKTVAGEPDKSDVMKGLNPVNRQSGAITAESVPAEYTELVENYFKAITTKKGEQP